MKVHPSLTEEERAMIKREYRVPDLAAFVWEDGTIFCPFNLDITLRCNARCPDCMKLLGLLPIETRESDVTREHVLAVSSILKRHKIRMGRLRVTGGEPTLIDDFKGMFEFIKRVWRPFVVRVYTNGILPLPWGEKRIGSVMRPMPMDRKKERHVPFYISPADLGIAPKLGFSRACRITTSCGRSIDAYGFSPCLMYPGIGRVLGRDLHYAHPKLLGEEDVCRHCICSLPKGEQRGLQERAKRGDFEYPTKTYREGIEREKEEPVKFENFFDRIGRSGAN